MLENVSWKRGDGRFLDLQNVAVKFLCFELNPRLKVKAFTGLAGGCALISRNIARNS